MKNYIEQIWGWDQAWQDNDFNQAFSTYATFVVERDAQCVGYFQIEAHDDHDYLRMLILAPAARSEGIGSTLLAQILEKTRRENKMLRLRVFKNNAAALRFYLRKGWQVEGEDDVFYLLGYSFKGNA